MRRCRNNSIRPFVSLCPVVASKLRLKLIWKVWSSILKLHLAPWHLFRITCKIQSAYHVTYPLSIKLPKRAYKSHALAHQCQEDKDKNTMECYTRTSALCMEQRQVAFHLWRKALWLYWALWRLDAFASFICRLFHEYLVLNFECSNSFPF